MSTQQKKGLKRNSIDKYYTKPAVVEFCIEQLKTQLTINDADLCIEPSAGNGAFIAGLKSLSAHALFYDLKPENSEIIQQDYLMGDYTALKDQYKTIHVIGNPPFGRQSSFAIKFIKKSCEFCDTVAFILPKSFKKESMKKAFPINFHLRYETDLPDKAFLVEEQEYTVPCVFQIWEKKSYARLSAPKLEPLNFQFVKKAEPHDISFRRVGVNAGAIDITTAEKSIQSHYFIKFTTHKSMKTILKKLGKITYEFNNTVGPKSISKQELIGKFNSQLA